jgi:hypothetical protein
MEVFSTGSPPKRCGRICPSCAQREMEYGGKAKAEAIEAAGPLPLVLLRICGAEECLRPHITSLLPELSDDFRQYGRSFQSDCIKRRRIQSQGFYDGRSDLPGRDHGRHRGRFEARI